MTAARVARALAGLYPVERDPRVGWLPDGPSAVEAHLRATGECDLVVGYGGGRLPELDDFVARCLAIEPGAPADREVWERFAAAATGALDAGLQLSADPARLQVYLRGHFATETVARCAAATGREADGRMVANAMALFSARDAEMVGLDLGGGAPASAVYLALPSRSRDDRAALRDRIGFLLDALLPGAPAAAMWREVAGELLVAPREEWVYVSFDPAPPAEPWVKIDAGARALALAGRAAAVLGIDVAPMLAAAGARGFDPVHHIGIRFGLRSPAISIYASVT
jgi:hypothetical protein